MLTHGGSEQELVSDAKLFGHLAEAWVSRP